MTPASDFIPIPRLRPAEFQRGHLYKPLEAQYICRPCPLKKFLRALKVKPLHGIIIGDEVVAAMEARGEKLKALPIPETLQKSKRSTPRNALDSVSVESILATRQRRN